MTDTPSPAATEAAKRFPDRPISLPEGPAVVVPVPERRAFIDGAAWQAAQSADAIAALRRQRDETRIRNDYLEMEASAREAEVERLTRERGEVLAVLEPFARHADAVSLGDALGHIERAHLVAARDLVAQLLRAAQDVR